MLDRVVQVAKALLLVFDDLSIKLVDQAIDGGVEICIRTFGEQVLAGHVQRYLGLLLQLVHREDDSHVDHMIEMVPNAFEFVGDVLAQCGRYDEMMTADRKIHASVLRGVTV